MDRIINVKVGGNHLSKDNKNAGVKGEGNVTKLRITFDEGWDGYAKTVTFFDALGGNPVKRLLTVDLIEDITKDARTYITSIPQEPLAITGELTFVIDGFYGEFSKNADGEYEIANADKSKRQRSIADTLIVKDAPMADNAAEPTDPIPTIPEQFQQQYDGIIGEIQAAQIGAETARDEAKTAEGSAKGYAEAAASKVEEAQGKVDEAQGYAKQAQEYQADAMEHANAAYFAANNAVTAITHNPIIVEGNWHVWDIVNEQYVDTGVKAQSGSTVYYGDNPPADADVWIDPDGESAIYTPYIGANKNWYTWSNETNGFVDSGICAEGKASSITVDSEISPTSENPVQNKVVYNEFNSFASYIGTKVDKVSGKGLSTNDYTDEEKEKLSALPSEVYSKTEVDAKISEGGGGVSTPTYTFRNLFNPNDENYEAGKYVNPANGKTANNARYNTSGYIEVSFGDRICLTQWMSNAFGEQWRDVTPITWYAYYDENKSVVKGDGRVSGEKIYHYIPYNVRYIRISIDSSTTEVMVEKLTCVGICDEYLAYGEEKNVVGPTVDNQDGIFLPPYIYAVKGRPFDIYTAAMFGDTQNLNRIERIGYTATGFGETQLSNRRLRLNPTGGQHLNLYLKVKNAEDVSVLSALTRVVVNKGSTATKRIVTIGDSLTDSKPWIAELMRLNPNYEFVGSISGTAKDSEGTEHTFKHDGRSGWRAEQYYTGYSPSSNKFWDADKGEFSFSYYVTNTLGGTAPDIVIIFLGMNDMDRNIDMAGAYEAMMILNIRESYPDMPIVICAPQARDYNVEGHVAKKGFMFMQWLYRELSSYQNLYLVPLYLIHDSEYNYRLADEQEGVNLYSTITQNKVVDSVHPQNPGYYQFADAIYGALSAIS